MPKREIFFSLDVEASGPIPGPNWMCSFGICRTDDPDVSFVRELQPLVLPGLAQADMPAAMEVVSKGLPDMLWSQLGDTPEAHDEVNPHDMPKDMPVRQERAWQRSVFGFGPRG